MRWQRMSTLAKDLRRICFTLIIFSFRGLLQRIYHGAFVCKMMSLAVLHGNVGEVPRIQIESLDLLATALPVLSQVMLHIWPTNQFNL